jgi:hypothetical protein
MSHSPTNPGADPATPSRHSTLSNLAQKPRPRTSPLTACRRSRISFLVEGLKNWTSTAMIISES